MSNVCRIGDLGVGTCYAHEHPTSFTTTFITGDERNVVNGRQVVRVGDLGRTSCGHTTMATSGSSNTLGSNGQGLHRIGDVGIVLEGGSYVAVTGSEDTIVGG